METLLMVKSQIIRIYARYESYILSVLKFILVLISVLMINGNIGYMSRLKNPAIALIVALLGSFLPLNATVLLMGGMIVAHVYELSLECAVVVLCVFILMFIVYFRFSPTDSAAVVLTPLLFSFNLPYIIPIALGLLGSPLSCVSVVCGVVAYYVMEYVKLNADQLASVAVDAESRLNGFKYVIDGMLKNDTMFLMALALAVTTILVFLISRLSLPYCWKIAIGLGSIVELIVLLVGSLSFDAEISVGFAILGIILGVIIGIIIEFFAFNVDYGRTENVQFQDDEYYYYVKAIPKVTLDTPQHKVKRINRE
ncbi:MAG: hypothetical protein K5770_11200 [Lachnospiraceae bacterium]|nr:hypothetical protein [Lachnospiraceae bacterium]